MKLTATPKAIQLIQLLKEKHGEILLEQSSGCCDGTVPVAFPAKGHYISSQLVEVGQLAEVPYYIEKNQLSYLQYMHQEIDVMDAPGVSFSLEAAEGVGFIIHSKKLEA